MLSEAFDLVPVSDVFIQRCYSDDKCDDWLFDKPHLRQPPPRGQIAAYRFKNLMNTPVQVRIILQRGRGQNQVPRRQEDPFASVRRQLGGIHLQTTEEARREREEEERARRGPIMLSCSSRQWVLPNVPELTVIVPAGCETGTEVLNAATTNFGTYPEKLILYSPCTVDGCLAYREDAPGVSGFFPTGTVGVRFQNPFTEDVRVRIVLRR